MAVVHTCSSSIFRGYPIPLKCRTAGARQDGATKRSLRITCSSKRSIPVRSMLRKPFCSRSRRRLVGAVGCCKAAAPSGPTSVAMPTYRAGRNCKYVKRKKQGGQWLFPWPLHRPCHKVQVLSTVGVAQLPTRFGRQCTPRTSTKYWPVQIAER